MKNSLPMMKNRMMPVRISEKEWFRPKAVEISPAPRSRNTSSREVKTMMMGLNFASHDTMTAVKPRPPAIVVVTVWLMPPTSSRPARPQIAPESAIVRMMTFSTLMPT